MNIPLFFALWLIAFTSLVSGNFFIHKHYTSLIQSDVQKFESEWKKLESNK